MTKRKCPPIPETPPKPDMVNSPSHYTAGGIEVADAIDAWQLDWIRANAVKYLARAQRKGTELLDLRKARWYIDRAIAKLEREAKP